MRERDLARALAGATSTTAEPPPPLTLDRLKDMMRAIPPAPFYASSTLLPSDKAYKFEHGGRVHVGAHPDFWRQVPKGEGRPSFADVPVIDLDADGEASREFFQAMGSVMMAAERERRADPRTLGGVINPDMV